MSLLASDLPARPFVNSFRRIWVFRFLASETTNPWHVRINCRLNSAAFPQVFKTFRTWTGGQRLRDIINGKTRFRANMDEPWAGLRRLKFRFRLCMYALTGRDPGGRPRGNTGNVRVRNRAKRGAGDLSSETWSYGEKMSCFTCCYRSLGPRSVTLLKNRLMAT